MEGGGVGREWDWDWKGAKLEGKERGKPGLKPLVLTALLGQLPHLNTFASAFMT